MKKLLIAAALIALASPTLAQDAVKPTRIAPDALAWKDAPQLPKGAQYVILIGDPTKAGEMFVQRVKFPANYQVPAHTHPFTEYVTVMSGSLGYGMGDKLDVQKGEMLKSGTVFVNPTKHPHYVWTSNEETILQVQGIGPGGIDYINPADDPRKAMATGTTGAQPTTGTSTPPATGTTAK